MKICPLSFCWGLSVGSACAVPLQGIARDLTLVLDSNFPLLLSTPEIPSWVHKFHLPSPACPSLFQNIVMLCVYFNASQNTCTLTVNIY